MTENLPDTNVGNIGYISKRDAVDAVEFGITLASAINIETGERTELFQRENDELREAVKRIKDIEPADVVPVNREKLMAVLRVFFSIGDSFTYELTRVKSAFEVGTMSLDDFEEWGEENISDLCDYIFRELRKESEHG